LQYFFSVYPTKQRGNLKLLQTAMSPKLLIFRVVGLAASGTGNIPPFTAINTGSTAVTATITATPLSPNFVYVANSGDNTVSVINVTTNLVTATIAVGAKPLSLSVSPDGTRVYVANSGDNSISVINTSTDKVIYTITQINSPYCVKVNLAFTLMYVANYNSKTVTVINTATNSVVTTIPVNDTPTDLCISPDGTRVYVIDGFNNIDVIDAITNKVINNFSTAGIFNGISVSPDGSLVYFTDSGYDYIGVIKTSTLTFANTISFSVQPYDVTVSPGGNTAYTSMFKEGTVDLINLANNSIVSKISVGTQPQSLFLNYDNSFVYVANVGSNSVSVINTSTNKVIANIPVGKTPNSVAGFIPTGTGCTPVTFTITVKPTPPLSIVAGATSGTISACAGTASASPDILQFTVSGNGLTSDITATAPANFEVSLTPGSGYGSSVTLAQSAGLVSGAVVYVRSAASAPAGSISGKVVLSSAGVTSQSVAVTGIVNALPTVDKVNDQKVNNGAATAAINFTGTGNTFDWVNDTPSIGLAASGTGDIPLFTAVNNGNSAVTATITVTPSSVQYAYIANFNGNTVSVFDIAANTIIATIPVGSNPVGVSISPDGKRVYVTNEQSNTVSVIDATNRTVTATIPVGVFPYGLAVSPDGKKVYVANDISNTVSVISTETNAVTATIDVSSGAGDISISPDGSKVYVSNNLEPSGIVSVIDAATNAVVSRITVGSGPEGIVVSPDGGQVYTANNGSNNVSVVNTANGATVALISVGNNPWGVSISPDGGSVYVANSSDNTVSVISTTSNSVTATIPVGNAPFVLAVSPDGNRVYVENTFGNTISVINTTTNKVISTITGFSGPFSLGNFLSDGTGCSGIPVKFTITVTVVPIIKAGLVTGNISACTGSASASPDVQQFTVSGAKLTGNITATAPPGFEVSVAEGSGYGSSVTLIQSSGMVNSTIIYVRSAATASTGNIAGNVVLTSPGATSQDVAVKGIVGAQVNPSISIAASLNNICVGAQVAFTATPTNGGSAPVYQWMVNGNNTGTNSPAFTSSSLGNGDMVSCVMTSNAACATPVNATSNSITMIVASPLAASVSIAASSNNICAGTPVTFTATPANGGSAPVYQWVVNGNNAGTNSPEFTSSTLVNGDIVGCLMTGNSACAALANATSNNITMIVNPSPIVSAGGSKSINEGSSTTLNATAPPNLTDITWSPATGLNNNKILNPVASPFSTTTYMLTVQTTDGCFGTDTATVKVLIPDVIIPNTFTPNGDGINDTWDIKYLGYYLNCTVQIFNRWGQSVYSSNGYGTPWDGTYKSAPLPTGTYYYVINLKNNSKLLSGYVAIIR
jgi:gliding motility-associated-like protein